MNYIINRKNAIAANIAKSFNTENTWEDSIEKGVGGEGSKGGNVIGHTKSGKPIYDKANHKLHSDFTSDDHKEAAKLHDALWDDANLDGDSSAMRKHSREQSRHEDLAKTGAKKSDKRYVNPEDFHGDERSADRQKRKED